VDSWRNSNPNITAYWWNVDSAVKTAIKQRFRTEVRGIQFLYKSGMLFIKLPFGRVLSYIKPRIGENQYGGESVTYMGIGSTKKWERIESYGPKFVENIVQAVGWNAVSVFFSGWVTTGSFATGATLTCFSSVTLGV